MREYNLKPNSSINIELKEGSALDLYIKVEKDLFYLGSLEPR
jgi:hypothetical protein